jgi:ppGpp synthetase/RelA/SpoT-type nucleotidyltranferase
MPINRQMIEEATERYLREIDRYIKLTRTIEEICVRNLVQSGGLQANITARTKNPYSFRKKLSRFLERKEKEEWQSVDDIFNSLSDFSGVRIALYSETDTKSVIERLQELFVLPDKKIDKKDKYALGKGSYYKAVHCQVALSEKHVTDRQSNLAGLTCEIQICSMMAHVWNEIEHDIAYKPFGQLSDEEKSALKKLGDLTRAGDKIIQGLIDANSARLKKADKIENENSLAQLIADTFNIRRVTFKENVSDLYDTLQELGIHSGSELRKAMGVSDAARKNEKTTIMWKTAKSEVESFNRHMKKQGTNLQLESRNSTDPALYLILKHLHGQILKPRGPGRPTRLQKLAKSYKEFATRRS